MELPHTVARFGLIWPDLRLAGRLEMRQGGLVWHSVHAYALNQRGLVVATFGLITSGQEWRNF